jgi:uncharacterized protein with PQ loop repeat
MLVFGWLGGILNSFHVLPQMMKIHNTKSVDDLSINSICIKILASVLYTIHGFVIWDLPLFVMTLLILAQYFTIFLQYKWYNNAVKCNADTAESDTTSTTQSSTETDDLA